MSKGVSNADRRYYERQSLGMLREVERRLAHAMTMPEALQNPGQVGARLEAVREVIASKDREVSEPRSQDRPAP